MGKTGKGEPEEDYEFVPEDFDEDAFIHKEMVSFRTTVVLFLVGIVAALISWAIFAGVDGARSGWFLGLLILAAAFYGLRFVYKALNIDIAHYQRREWIGTGFLIFFTWLGFLMLFINPPFSDFAEPVAEVYVQPGAPEIGSEAMLEFRMADNDAIAYHRLVVMGPAGVVLDIDASSKGDREIGSAHALTVDAGTYTYALTVQDDRGLTTNVTGQFHAVDDALRVSVGDLTDPQQTVFVQTAPGLDLYAVYLDIAGSDDHVYLEFDEASNGWRATANFKGWKAGSNNFTVVAQEKNHFFQGTTLVTGATLTDGPHTAEVGAPGEYNKGKPKRANPTVAPAREVPGLEVPVVAMTVMGLAMVARRR